MRERSSRSRRRPPRRPGSSPAMIAPPVSGRGGVSGVGSASHRLDGRERRTLPIGARLVSKPESRSPRGSLDRCHRSHPQRVGAHGAVPRVPEAQTVAHSAIVVDNASTDGTPENVRASCPEVRLVALDRNLGFAAACNRAAAAGTGDVIVLLNNDVFAQPTFLERIVRATARERGRRVGVGAPAPAGRAHDRQLRAHG